MQIGRKNLRNGMRELGGNECDEVLTVARCNDGSGRLGWLRWAGWRASGSRKLVAISLDGCMPPRVHLAQPWGRTLDRGESEVAACNT
jgi:hypothetical protein